MEQTSEHVNALFSIVGTLLKYSAFQLSVVEWKSNKGAAEEQERSCSLLALRIIACSLSAPIQMAGAS